jgi:hypothetical protein
MVRMTQWLTSFGVAVGVVAMIGVGVRAQSNESKTKVKTEHAQQVTYTGCLLSGTETQRYVLDHVVPISKTETIGTAGTMTTTTYALIPSEQVELQRHVGHKIEVTGVLIPAGKGDAKIETKTKGKGTAEEHSKTEIERGPMPQLRVMSIKHLAESCS